MWTRNNEVVKIYTRSRDTQTRSNNCFGTRSHFLWARNYVFAPVVIKYTKFTPVVSILFSKLGYIKTADRNRLEDILNDLLLVYDVSDKEKDSIDILALAQKLANSWDYDKTDKTPWSERYGMSIV